MTDNKTKCQENTDKVAEKPTNCCRCGNSKLIPMKTTILNGKRLNRAVLSCKDCNKKQ